MAHIDFEYDERAGKFCSECGYYHCDNGDFYEPPSAWCEEDALPNEDCCPYKDKFFEEYPECKDDEDEEESE